MSYKIKKTTSPDNVMLYTFDQVKHEWKEFILKRDILML